MRQRLVGRILGTYLSYAVIEFYVKDYEPPISNGIYGKWLHFSFSDLFFQICLWNIMAFTSVLGLPLYSGPGKSLVCFHNAVLSAMLSSSEVLFPAK